MHTWLHVCTGDTNKQRFCQCSRCQGVMAIFNHLLLVLSLAPLVLSYPFYPPTCYTKVLSMARDLTQWAADLKRDPETVSQLLCCHSYRFLLYIHQIYLKGCFQFLFLKGLVCHIVFVLVLCLVLFMYCTKDHSGDNSYLIPSLSVVSYR